MPASVRDVLLLIKTREDASRALRGISNEMRRAQTSSQIASARAQAAALRAQAAQARSTGATRAQVDALMASARAYDRQASEAADARKQTENFRRTIVHAGEGAQAAGLAIGAAGAAMAYGLKQSVDVAVEWERQVRHTFTQVDKRFKPSLQALSDIGIRTARSIAVPFEEIQVALFDVFSSTEANLKDAEVLLRAFSKAAVAGQTDIQSASRATIGLMNAYSVPFKDVNRVLDIQFQLIQEGVGTYEEWAQRIGLVTPSAVRANQSIETMAAALATSTRLGTSAARSGTAVARAFDAISNPKTVNNLEDMGIKVRNAKGELLPLVDILGQWREKLMALPPKERVGDLLETIKGAGSTIEARRFLQNMLLTKDGFKLFQEILGEMKGDLGAFDRAYAEMSAGTAAKTELLRNKWMELKLRVGEALLPAFNQVLDALNKLFTWFNNLPESTRKLITQFLLWSSAIGIAGGALLIIIGTITMFVTAIAGVASTVGIVVGVLAGAVGAIAGWGYAIYQAYTKSEEFRLAVGTLWQTVQQVAGVFVAFGQRVREAFMTHLMPSLRELWAVIESQVLPAVREFYTWFQANIIPKMREAARIASDVLGFAFEKVGQIVRGVIIPAIKDLVKWWHENKAAILPVIQFLGQVAKWMAIVAAVIVGTLIVGIVALIAVFIRLGTWAIKLVTIAIGALVSWIKTVIGWVRSFFQWLQNLGSRASSAGGAIRSAANTMGNAFRNFYNTAVNAIKNVISTVQQIPARIRGAFAGAGSWLISAGRDVIMGLVNGIRGAIGSAANAAANVAKTAISAAKSALRIGSPSKEFRDIGKDVIRGFVLGMSGNKKKVSDVMFRISRDVIRSIKDADISRRWKRTKLDRWTKKLSTAQRTLMKLVTKREGLEKRLATAQKSVNDQIKARADLTQKVTEAVSASADITTLTDKQKKSTGGMVEGLQQRLEAVKKFQTQLRSLAVRGFDKETIAQLASQGVDQAGMLVNTLAQGSSADLKQISRLQQEIRKIAGSTGSTVAGDLYNAGIKAGEGLVKGLQKSIASITKQMTSIANALVKAIKKELGIRSPSRVFMDIGSNTAQGFVSGYRRKMSNALSTMQRATMFEPAFGSPGRVGFGPPPTGMLNSGGSGVTYDQKITVHTQEIDPRRHAAELGWELEGRLG